MLCLLRLATRLPTWTSQKASSKERTYHAVRAFASRYVDPAATTTGVVRAREHGEEGVERVGELVLVMRRRRFEVVEAIKYVEMRYPVKGNLAAAGWEERVV